MELSNGDKKGTGRSVPIPEAKALAEGKKVVTAETTNSGVELMSETEGTTSDGDKLKALFEENHAGAAGSGNVTITLNQNYDLTEYSWSPLTVDGYNGAGVVTVEGNGHTITGLTAPLFDGGFAGNSGIVIKNLTLKDVRINDTTSNQGIGAFICNVDSMPKIELDKCHLSDSIITSTGGARVGGLIGWTSGYDVTDDGPVDTIVTITGCSVKNTQINAAGSVGAIIGHAGCNSATYHTISNNTVTNCTLNSTDDGGWRVGVVVGTANVGVVTISNITESDNTLTQTKKTTPEHSNLYGRFVPDGTGKLTIDGFASDTVAAIGNVGYNTLANAVSAADGKTVTLRQNVTENVTIPAGTTLTLDLNGCTLSGGTDKVDDVATAHKDKPAILNEGTLTIKDSKGTGVVKRDDVRVGGDSYYVIDNQGTMTIEGGNYFNDSGVDGSGSSLIRNAGKSKAATLNIRGGTFRQDNFIAIKNDDYGILNITGGEINSANESAVQNWAQANITGGTVNGLIWTSVWSETFDASKTIISDNAVVNGTIRADKYAPSLAKTPVTEISGGTFAVDFDIRDNAYPTITGGTFSSKPAYVASGYHAVLADGSYTVHAFEVTSHADKAPTCTVPGNVAYFTCSGCGAGVYYSDASCTTKLDKVAIDALGHSYSDAWTTNPDKHWHECSVCHAVKDEAAHTFEKSGIVGGEYEWTCNVCSYNKLGPADAHAINTSKITNGTVVADPNPATVGQSVKLTLTPKDGYSDTDVQLYYSYDDVVNAELSNLTFIMPDAAVTISGEFKPIEYKITYNLDGGTNSTANPSTYTVEGGFTLTAPTKSGYTFLGWSFNNNSDIIKEVTVKAGSTGDVTFTAHWSYNGGSSSGGGGGSTGGSSSSTTTEKNPDGSTTTTTTDKTTGTVTEVTKDKDGTTTTVETKKDGTVTETVKTPEGVTGTVVTDKNGDLTEAKATVSTTAAKEAAKTGEAVTLPVEVPAVKTTEEAPALQVTVPKSADSVKVEIPVEKVTPGTVAVIVNADGTEKIVSTSVVTENGVALTLDGNATVKIIDNSKSFTDVPADSVFYNEISSLSAREIMVGKTDDKFDLHSSVTLDQIANVAGRITGAVDVKDFNAGVSWGADNGLKTGGVAATRGDVLKALYIAAGSPAVEDTSILSIFNDSSAIPADMAAIAAWAAQNGILKGGLDGNASLGVNVTRGQACALAGRTMGTLD